MNELKPCPCCSTGEGLFRERSRNFRDSYRCDVYSWSVYCSKCGLETKDFEDAAIRDSAGIRLTQDGRALAAEAWNSRAERTCTIIECANEEPYFGTEGCSSCGKLLESFCAFDYCPGCGARIQKGGEPDAQ